MLLAMQYRFLFRITEHFLLVQGKVLTGGYFGMRERMWEMRFGIQYHLLF